MILACSSQRKYFMNELRFFYPQKFLDNCALFLIGDRPTHAITVGVDFKTVSLIGHSVELFLVPFQSGLK